MSNISTFENEGQRFLFLKTLKEFLAVLLFLSLILLAGYYFLGLKERKILRLKCDAETIGLDLGLTAFINDGNAFSSGKKQSGDFSFRGKYSMRLDNIDPFGFQFELPYLKGNEQITASVWRFADGKNTTTGIMVASSKGFWKAGEEVVEKSASGWEKIQFNFSPPSKCKNQIFEIYCWNNGINPIWFDDLEIEIRYEENL